MNDYPNPILGSSETEQVLSSTTCQGDSPMDPYIHNLPTELLAQILLHSLTSGSWERSWKLFGMASITRLRSVCLRWNETILGEPAFWTHINEDDVIETSSGVENKIRRSGVLPLTIQYQNWGDVSDSGEEPPEYPEFFKFIELISRHTNRWKSLFIRAYDYELCEVLGCLEEQYFPELRNLEVRRGSVTESVPDWILHGTPKLQRLSLDGCMVPSSCSPLRSLAALEVEGAISALDKLIDMIQQSENLEELVLSDIRFDDHNVESQMDIRWPDESHPTLLQKLKKIQITDFQSNPAVACVLKCIHSPTITNLLVSGHQSNQAHGGKEIVRALTLHMGQESLLTSMLCAASSGTSLELEGFEEHMAMELKDLTKGLYYRVKLSLPEEDREEILVMLAAVVRFSGLPVRLRFGWQPLRILVDVFSLFRSAKEFELVSSDTPIGDVLQLFSLLSHPLRNGEGIARWVCPGLARFCLNGQRSELELAVLRNKAAKLTRRRKDFNNEESQRHGRSESDGCLEVVKVLVDGVEL
ncbi:hypothetical protein FS837_000496 [Tulasnella sp. UAMH 9824]|nr:hypothetical protein FS837_000496 [Tulasnella sp. UAMH 9824]